MKKLKELIEKCAGEVSIYINPHRNVYKKLEKYIDEEINGNPCLNGEKEIENKLRSKIIFYDCLVCLWFYPKTPMSSYAIYHYDVEAAVDIALDILEE